MTREEAIAILQEEIDGNLELTLSEWRERDEQKLFPSIRMAIKALQADDVSREVYDKRTQADEEIIDSYRQEFQKALSADAVQGEWVRKEREYNDCDGYYAHYWYECSVCGARPPKNQWKNEWHSNFCPSCGARMKGGGE